MSVLSDGRAVVDRSLIHERIIAIRDVLGGSPSSRRRPFSTRTTAGQQNSMPARSDPRARRARTGPTGATGATGPHWTHGRDGRGRKRGCDRTHGRGRARPEARVRSDPRARRARPEARVRRPTGPTGPHWAPRAIRRRPVARPAICLAMCTSMQLRRRSARPSAGVVVQAAVTWVSPSDVPDGSYCDRRHVRRGRRRVVGQRGLRPQRALRRRRRQVVGAYRKERFSPSGHHRSASDRHGLPARHGGRRCARHDVGGAGQRQSRHEPERADPGSAICAPAIRAAQAARILRLTRAAAAAGGSRRARAARRRRRRIRAENPPRRRDRAEQFWLRRRHVRRYHGHVHHLHLWRSARHGPSQPTI
jgi:hypothetical protein